MKIEKKTKKKNILHKKNHQKNIKSDIIYKNS